MITVNKGTLLSLTGGVELKQRVQHPKVHERIDRGTYYWFFRYRHDELLPDGSIKTVRKFHTIGPSRGENAIGRKPAEIKRDLFLAELNAAPTRCEAAVVASQPIDVTAILFGKLAELWRKDYVDNPKVKLATPTREKYRTRLEQSHSAPMGGYLSWGVSDEGDPRLAPARMLILAHDDRSAEYHERHFSSRPGMGDHTGDVRQSHVAREGWPEVDSPPRAHPR